MKNKIFVCELADGYYVGFGFNGGEPVGSFINEGTKLAKNRVESIFRTRFTSQLVRREKDRKCINHSRHGRNHLVFEWFDFNDLNEINAPMCESIYPPKEIARKPKVWEIQKDGNGFKVVKHEHELFDADEVKVQLFSMSVNDK